MNRSAGNSLPEEPRPVSAPDPELTLVEQVDDPPLLAPMDHPESDPQVLMQAILKVILGGVLIVAGWFVYTQFLRHATQRAFQTLAGTHTVTASSPKSVTLKPTFVFAAPAVAGPGTEVLAVRKQQALLAGNAMQKKKDQAWAAFYTAPASCEHPADWSSQVDCGNQYMRAKKVFEQRWVAQHAPRLEIGVGLVLDNGLVGAVHR